MFTRLFDVKKSTRHTLVTENVFVRSQWNRIPRTFKIIYCDDALADCTLHGCVSFQSI